MDAKKIGNAIKILRKKRGFTQYDLADALNVSDKAISKWERGISIPDISVITELSLLLNVDVDNLLEGNISYLDETWSGVFIGAKEYSEISLATVIYGKPVVYFILSYFMLAGVRDITLYINCKDKAYMENEFGCGEKYGLELKYKNIGEQIETKNNTMLVQGYLFLYGPNLTKYFQRAMSHLCRATILAANRKGSENSIVKFDSSKKVVDNVKMDEQYQRVPILFVPHTLSVHLKRLSPLKSLMDENVLYAEPMGRGMIDCYINTLNDVNDISDFIRFVEERTSHCLYDIVEVARNRRLK